jgi:hypothetical protein
VNDAPVHFEGPWSINDMKQGLWGHPPASLGSPDLRDAGQMPGFGKHEITPEQHRGNSVLHPNQYNQGVTDTMREQGKVVGQGTRWVIGGNRDKLGVASGETNAFHFVIASDKPFSTTNLTAKVTFSRVVLEGGKVADVNKSVNIEHASK